MAENKKQHYVPQFYQKLFSADKKRICVFNIKNENIIRDVVINTQAQENYFYGKDKELEHFLDENIERPVNTIIESIINLKCMPYLASPEYNKLIMFIMLQHLRTKKSAELFDESTIKPAEKFIDIYDKGKNRDHEFMEKLGLKDYDKSNAASLSTITAFFTAYNLLDLDYCLLENRTLRDFIISDSPIVLNNQFLTLRHWKIRTGLKYMGLQIFFPISPKFLILLYDKNVYKVGNKKTNHYIIIYDEKDVTDINILQMIHAKEIVLFHPTGVDSYIRKLYKTAKIYRKSENTIIEVEDNKTVFAFVSPIEYKLKLTFIHIFRKISKMKLENDAIPLRNGSQVKINSEIEHIKI